VSILPCPSHERLAECATGGLDAAAAAEIRRHVGGCEYCRAVLDAFLRALATAPGSQPAGDGAAGMASGQPPRRLRDYVLADKLGEGGMGAVYKAYHARLDRVVAIKVLPEQRLRDPDALARFEREMKAVGRLDHPNIVRATDAGEVNGVHFLVMEYVEGSNLDALVKRLGPLPVARACEIVRQAAMGLQHAHDHGLVHRDVKPSNVMLTSEGQVKVLDLGLALLEVGGNGRDLTRTSEVMGTLDYMAPEQASNVHAVDARADVYSLGCTLYKLLTGEAPFADSRLDTPIRKMMAHAQKPVPPLRDRRPDVPETLAAVVERMLAKDPAQRYASAAEAAAALAAFAAASPAVSPADPERTQPWSGPLAASAPPRQPAWRPAAVILLLGVVVAGLAVGIWRLWQAPAAGTPASTHSMEAPAQPR
jgi:serine/threonine protein kinase